MVAVSEASPPHAIYGAISGDRLSRVRVNLYLSAQTIITCTNSKGPHTRDASSWAPASVSYTMLCSLPGSHSYDISSLVHM